MHFGWRVLARGLGRLRFEPGAAVGHRSPRARLQEDYVLLRAYRCGVEDIRMRDALGQADANEVDVDRRDRRRPALAIRATRST